MNTRLAISALILTFTATLGACTSAETKEWKAEPTPTVKTSTVPDCASLVGTSVEVNDMPSCLTKAGKPASFIMSPEECGNLRPFYITEELFGAQGGKWQAGSYVDDAGQKEACKTY